MTWLFRFKFKRFLSDALWLFPVLGVLLAMILGPLARWADQNYSLSLYILKPEGARALLGPLVASLFTFVVFVISTLLLVTQLASSNLTPRVIHFVLNDKKGKIFLGIFTFSFTYSLEVLSRIEQTVPLLPLNLAIFANVTSFILFFVFVQNVGHKLLPSVIMESWAEKGRGVVEKLYPQAYSNEERHATTQASEEEAKSRVMTHPGPTGVILAFGTEPLVEEARRVQGWIKILPSVGDYVPRGEPLFRIFPANAPWSETKLHSAVAIGTERTIDQDPAYALRLIVDVASKALSPGINDPTTAVLALDQIQSLLKILGNRRLDLGEVRDSESKLRLIYATPTWEQYVDLGVSEIRLFGTSSLQIARRLQAMLTYLIRVLPESRHPPLREELNLLHEMVKKHYDTIIDQKRALMDEVQGA